MTRSAEPVFSIAGKLESRETVGPGRCASQPEHSQHRADDEVNLGVAFWIIKVLVRVTKIKHQTESSVQKAHHSNKYIKMCIRREIETLQKCNFAILVFIFCERNSTRFSVGQIYRLSRRNIERIINLNLLQYFRVIKGSVFTFYVERKLG